MLIIFDFDGVICRASWPGLFEAYEAIIRAGGKEPRAFFKNLKEFKKWWRPDWRENDRKLGIPTGDDMDELFYLVYNRHAHLFSWVGAVTEKLAKRHTLAVFTNRHRENTLPFLIPVKDHFRLVVGSEDVRNLKPHPEGILKLLKETGIRAKDTLMIGDMPDDLRSGQAAGTKTGAVKWGLGKWEDLLDMEPDHRFERYKDLLRI